MKHIHLVSCTSTMDEAARLAREGAENLTLVTADEQTAGRGRQGKSWKTLVGQSFAGSFVVREGLGPHLALVMSLAVLEAGKRVNPLAELTIKWPNDILRDGKKIAGILVEMAAGGAFAVVGIGVNLGGDNGAEEGFNGAFLDQLSSFRGLNVWTAKLGACVSAHLHLYSEQGWPAFADSYRQNCETIGLQVVWKQSPTTEIFGTVIGLNDDGALMLKDESGQVRLIHAGEIISQGRQL